MIREDLEKEMETSRADEAKAQKLYEKNLGAMKAMLDAQTASMVALKGEDTDLEQSIFNENEFKDQKTSDQAAEQKLSLAIYTDCSWVATHFDTRHEKRKNEIDGLVEAKGYLAGVEAGDELAIPP